MSRSVNILHLSDFHVDPEFPAASASIFTSLCAQIRRFRSKKDVHVKLLIVSGDLSNKGKGGYDEILRRIINVCRASGCDKDRVFIVPGNHDVNWSKLPGLHTHLVKSLKDNPGICRNLGEIHFLNALSPGLSDYCGLAADFPLCRKGPLEPLGNSSADISISGIPIRLCGLNTALVAGPEDSQKKDKQLKDRVVALACLTGMLDCGTRLPIVVSHYPLDWIHEKQRDETRQRLQASNAIYMHGHVHEEEYRLRGLSSSGRLISVGAGSVYGRGWEDGNHFQIASFDPDREKPRLYEWIWSRERGWRGLDFVELSSDWWEFWRASFHNKRFIEVSVRLSTSLPDALDDVDALLRRLRLVAPVDLESVVPADSSVAILCFYDEGYDLIRKTRKLKLLPPQSEEPLSSNTLLNALTVVSKHVKPISISSRPGSIQKQIDVHQTTTTGISLDTEDGVKDPLRAYTQNLSQELRDNLVVELYDKRYLEDICVTPLVQALDEPEDSPNTYELQHLINAWRSLIVGPMGTGKTTALRLLALRLLNQSPIEVVPIYLPLASFASSSCNDDTSSFLLHLDSRLLNLECLPLKELERIPNVSILLLLDGWDELSARESRMQVIRYLETCQHHCIITSRSEALGEIPATEIYKMCPLSAERMEEFIRLRLGHEDQVKRLTQWISSTPSIQELACNPLDLSIITVVFEQSGKSVSQFTKTELYRKAFQLILRQAHHECLAPGMSESLSQSALINAESILKHIAYVNMRAGRGRFFSKAQLAQASLRAPKTEDTCDQLLSGKLGILRRRGPDQFEFFHMWYQEYLASCEILDSVEDPVIILRNPKMSICLPYVVGLVADNSSKAFELMNRVDVVDIYSYCRAIPEGKFGEDEKYQLLMRVISKGEPPEQYIPARVEMSRALVQAGPSSLSVLYSIVKKRTLSSYARRSALEAIAVLERDAKQFDKLLLELLDDSREDLLWHVIEHIGRRRLTNAINVLDAQVASLDDPIAAGDAIWAIQEIRNTTVYCVTEELIEKLLGILQGSRHHAQGHAIRTIGRLCLVDALPKLHAHFLRRGSEFRWIVPEAVSRIGGQEALEILGEALRDTDPRVVAEALQGLGRIEFQIPTRLIEDIKAFAEDRTWIPHLNRTIGAIARSTLVRLRPPIVNRSLPTIYIARHCRTAWSEENRIQGKQDESLSPDGIREAETNTKMLVPLNITRIVSSNAKRAEQTAQIYASSLDVPLHTTPRLRELDHGIWEGEIMSDLWSKPKSRFAEWMANPASQTIPGSMESVTSAQERAKEAIREIVQSFRGERVLVVSHKHLIALLACALYRCPLTSFSAMIDNSVFPREIPEPALTKLFGETVIKGEDAVSTLSQ